VGCLPTYQTVGSISGYILIFLRIVQGLAIGGEYGGDAIYVAEHSPQNRRGYYTGFIQLAAPLGFLLSILIIIIIKVPMETTGNAEMFLSWVTTNLSSNHQGWRIPFLISFFLCGIAIHIRMNLAQSPMFAKVFTFYFRLKNHARKRTRLRKALVRLIMFTIVFWLYLVPLWVKV
jgi:MFS family permease